MLTPIRESRKWNAEEPVADTPPGNDGAPNSFSYAAPVVRYLIPHLSFSLLLGGGRRTSLPPSRPCYAKPGRDWRHLRGGLVRLAGLEQEPRLSPKAGFFVACSEPDTGTEIRFH